MARGWNVTLLCLWLLLAVYQAAYVSCDECDNQNLPGQLLFAPKRLLSSGSCLTATVATWRGCSHLRPRGYRYRRLSYYHWLILLSKDVERNPGPVKFPCTRCCKAVKQNDRAIQCDRCDNWSHATCCGISHKQYQLHTKLGDTEEWLCHACIASDLPFGNVSSISDSLSTSYPSQASSSFQTVSNGIVRHQGLLQCSLNARSVMNKKLDIQALLVAEYLDVLAVTETFLGDEILDSELVGGDYTIFRRDRNRRGGGVMLYVKNSISAIRRTDLETNCEVLWVELSTGPSKVLLGTFYRPPSSTHEYLTQLEMSLASIPESYTIVLCGDFNLPHLDWAEPSSRPPSRVASAMLDITQDFSLQQLACL